MKLFVSSGTLKLLFGVVLGMAIMVTAGTRSGPNLLADAPAQTPAAAPATGVLTDDLIRTWLTNLAYQFTEQKTKTGSLFDVIVNSDDWKLDYNLDLSPNQQYLWMSTGGQTIPTNTKVDIAAHLRALLEANDQSPSAYFSVDPNSGLININKVTENRGFTPFALKQMIDDFDAFMRRTGSLWDTSGWGPQPGTAAPAPGASQWASRAGKHKASPSKPVKKIP